MNVELWRYFCYSCLYDVSHTGKQLSKDLDWSKLVVSLKCVLSTRYFSGVYTILWSGYLQCNEL